MATESSFGLAVLFFFRPVLGHLCTGWASAVASLPSAREGPTHSSPLWTARLMGVLCPRHLSTPLNHRTRGTAVGAGMCGLQTACALSFLNGPGNSKRTLVSLVVF